MTDQDTLDQLADLGIKFGGDMTDRTSTPPAPGLRELEQDDPFMPHDHGCRCWPHVSQRAAIEASIQAAVVERRAALRAESVAAPAAPKDALYAEIGKRLTDARVEELMRQVAIPLHGRGVSVDLQAREVAAMIRRDAMNAIDAALAAAPPALDAAWAEVEAALPQGWRLRLTRTDDDFDVWEASAVSPAFFNGENDSDAEYEHGEAATPVAALQALAAILRTATPASGEPLE